MSDGATVTPPVTGLVAMRIGMEFGGAEEFGRAFGRALARGGQRGATLVATLGGELSIHLPAVDGPSWNTVPLLHLHAGDPAPTDAEWAVANGILEKLERSR